MHGFEAADDWLQRLANFHLVFELATPDGEVLGYEQWPMPRLFRGERLQDLVLKLRKIGQDWERTFRYNGAIVCEPSGEQLVFLTITDITARHQAEEKMKEQAALLDKAQDAIIVRELDHRIIYWNKSAERLYGWTTGEVLGRSIESLLYDDPNAFLRATQSVLATGEWVGEIEQKAREGRRLTVEGRWTLVRDRHGAPKSILAINTDVTDRKHLEAQFLRAQRLESIGTLASGIAHDLNNILSPIMMSVEILRTLVSDPKAADLLEMLELGAQRGASIVRQVLSFGRGMDGERIEVSPKHLLKDIEHIIRNTFRKNINLDLTAPESTWTILGDPTQLHQVLLNLCVNARDAMPNGGTLTVHVANHTVDDQYAAMNVQARPGNYLKLSVSDTGTGMPQHVVERIFEPFFTTKELGKGTGLGLSTVIAIIKSHGGFVNVYSELGKGTTFRVYLPYAQGVACEEARAVLTSPPRGMGECILVIDDESTVLTITSQTLEAFGYRVLTASNGAEGIALYAQRQKDIAVVLTDMMMPVMDGATTIYALVKINPVVRIIAASGLGMNGQAAKAANSGVKHFLSKPFTARTLLEKLREVLTENQ